MRTQDRTNMRTQEQTWEPKIEHVANMRGSLLNKWTILTNTRSQWDTGGQNAQHHFYTKHQKVKLSLMFDKKIHLKYWIQYCIFYNQKFRSILIISEIQKLLMTKNIILKCLENSNCSHFTLVSTYVATFLSSSCIIHLRLMTDAMYKIAIWHLISSPHSKIKSTKMQPH